MSVKMSTEQVIRVRKNEFEKAQRGYEQKLKVQAELRDEYLYIMGGGDVDEEALFNDPLGYLLKSIEAKYKKQNTLLLGGGKLAELLGINLDRFKVVTYKYNNDLKKIVEPHIENFTDYAIGEVEIKRLEYVKKLLALVSEYESEHGGRVTPREIIFSHSPRCLFFNHNENAFQADINFVKGITQRW